MSYNNMISRNDAAALIPEEASREIFKSVAEQSAFMQLARQLPNMSRGQTRLPVLSSLPTAYFVAEGGMKKTTEVNWLNKYVYAEEIACIVPIPESVLDDADYDIWAEIQPNIAEAFGAVVDSAVFFGTNKPTNWPDGILTAAVAASNTADLSTIVAADGDLYDAIMGENGSLSKLETDGFMATGHVAAMSLRGKLRGLRTTQGEPIFRVAGMAEATQYLLDGEQLLFPRNGSMDASQALLFSADWNHFVWSVRQDITYKLLTEGVIQDTAGNIVYNLAQQDMVALRCVMRMGWQVPNPTNRINTSNSTRYPAAVLVP